MIYQDPQMIDLAEQVRRVARKDRDVPFLVLGETGVGKNVMARYIHDNTPGRSTHRFIEPCLLREGSLLDTELFGCRKGAFTGALEERKGAFALANDGTIFLDEIGDLSPETQLKMLKIVEERRYIPVGEVEPIETNVRIIAATNKPLEESQSRTYFRDDLYYRLSEEVITIPPLRERPEDIIALSEHFLGEKNQTYQTTYVLEEDDQSILLEYSFPGNVRELEHMIGGAVRRSETSEFNTEWLADYVITHERKIRVAPTQRSSSENPSIFLTLNEVRQRAEKEHIKKVLLVKNYNIVHTAEALRMNRGTLRDKMKQYGLYKSSA